MQEHNLEYIIVRSALQKSALPLTFEDTKMNGRIKNIHEDKNFGFIRGEDNKEYFFHRTALVNDTDWNECSRDRNVTFIPTTSTKGFRAEEVMVMD